MPAEQAARLNAAVTAAAHDPSIADRMGALGLTPLRESPADFARVIAAEIPRNRALVAAARIEPQ
jgi:tripartite-type tricarboxylate transporter receptor subunit TctC